MKKTLYVILILAAVAIGSYFFINKKSTTNVAANSPNVSDSNVAQNSTPIPDTSNQNNQAVISFQSPLSRAVERVTKKPFGIYITPKTSPVQPEKFQGYHTGTDFEIFPEELNINVPVHAVCNGKLVLKEYASGYGGVAVESCELGSQPITVIYGHLNLASINVKSGENIKVGDVLGNLGTAYSAQTDGERKHLHLGFHKGSSISILGYVSSQSQLSDWINPCTYVCF
jgi:murein DD-endopeptidase MepM/ murein hydrolase activator NlpD